MTTLYGVVDIGGTKTLIGIATENEIIETIYLKTSDLKSPEMLIDTLVEEFDKLISQSNYKDEVLKSVGISVPGPLNREEGIIHFTGNLNWSNFPIIEYLQKKMNQIPVIIDDDANAAGIGEAVYGAGRSYKNQIYVTISTGIGGAIVIDGQIYRGSRDLAGEIGHMTVVPDGPPCSCGNFGCLEALASGTAITQKGQQILIQEQSKILSKIVGQKTLTAEMIFEAVRQGDKACYSIIQQVCRYLGIGLANLVQIFNPETIILGGGIMNQSSLLIPKIETEMNNHLFKVQRGHVNIELASLNGQSGLWGALHLAKNHIASKERE
ncbi:ROK family protein [Metabacillus niabensis]|uniref:Glucokinase n=1 Tax=Metabacillus niabensis TaxID=324854 RepID=A0ABT9Z509_9BACI|nr:ROK family protein [Metabacillus niabensis]MDQ0227341.1 glucokinase [Metabacillus niabensis]